MTPIWPESSLTVVSVLPADGSIGVYDLKNSLSAVLDEVAEGREVTVTRHGHPIARLSPVVRSTQEQRAAAIRTLHALAEGVAPLPKGVTVRDLIEDGRRR